MKNTSLLLLALVAATVICTDFDFDLKNSKIQTFDAWDQITFPCKGGSNDYDYDFEWLPKNWFASKGKVYAPKGQINSNRNFGIRVSVFDRATQRSLKRSLLFNFNNRSFKNLFDAEYKFDLDNQYNIDDYIFRRARGEIPNLISNRPEVIIRPSYQFPSDTEIESIIIKGDVAWIKRIIDEAIESGNQCKVVSDFLSRVLTLIQSHISIFRNDAEGIRQDIFQLREELNFLVDQLKQLQGSKLDLSLLRQKIATFRRQLELSLQQKTSLQIQISNNEEKIQSNQREIFTITETVIRDAQLGADSESQKIRKADEDIRALESQLDLLRRSRQTSINNRELFLARIREARQKTGILTRANERLQGIILQLRNEFSSIESKIVSINVKIEELERQINNIGFGKDAEIREIRIRINTLESQITAESDEARKIELIFSALEGSLGEFERTINRHYYSCYRVIDINDNINDNNVDSGNDFIAATPSNAFLNYLKEVFGSTPNSNIRARFGGDIINIKHSTIFSPSWVRVYGIPFSAGYGNNMDIMQTDFKCEEVADLEVFSGRIESITQNVINVKDKHGDSYTVHLGGCTRLETATGNDIPAVGNQVYWKGLKRRNGQKREFNGYHFTCY